MQIGKIADFSINRKLPFGADDKTIKEKTAVVDDDDDDDEEEESFYERNKTAINAIVGLGLAGISIAAYKHFKPKKLKSGIKQEPTPPEVPSLKKYESQQNLIDALKGKSEDEMADVLTTKLNSVAPKSRYELIDGLILEDCSLSSSSKYVNGKTWETMLDGLMGTKPEDKIKPEDIQKNVSRLFGRLINGEFLTPEIVDKIIGKMPAMSDEVKIITASKLVHPSINMSTGKDIHSILTQEQTKKILGHIADIKDSSVRFEHFELKTDNNVPSNVRYRLYTRYFLDSEFDNPEDLNFLREAFVGKKLTPELQFKLVDKVGSFIPDYPAPNKDALKTLMRALVDMTHECYMTDDILIKNYQHSNFKFVLGANLVKKFRFDPKTDDLNEYLGFIDKFIESAKKVRRAGAVDTKHFEKAGFLGELMKEKINVQTKVFMEKHKGATYPPYEEINKFVDDIFAQIADMKVEAGHWHNTVKASLSSSYEEVSRSIIQDLLNNIYKKSFLSSDYVKNGELRKKISDFGKMNFGHGYCDWSHFGGYGFDYSNWRPGSGSGSGSSSGGTGWGGSGSSWGGSSGGSWWGGSSWGGSSGSSRTGGSSGSGGGSRWRSPVPKSKEEKAKETLLARLREFEDCAELAQNLENGTMDAKLLKSIKRVLSIKFHPDKHNTEGAAAQQEYTRIYQELSGALDVLEKSL